jgi:hypothetical protein
MKDFRRLMANDAPNTERNDGSADDYHDGTHEIAGIKVGENSVPASAIFVFIFIIAIALLIAWIPAQGF